jgi:hypothetical protein
MPAPPDPGCFPAPAGALVRGAQAGALRTIGGMIGGVEDDGSGATPKPEGPVRDRAADEREAIADVRDRAADEREAIADVRDRAADERERIADEREVRLAEREGKTDERERWLAGIARRLGFDWESRLQQSLKAIGRSRVVLADSEARLSRSEASINRSEAHLRREDARGKRDQADIDRSMAQAERDGATRPTDTANNLGAGWSGGPGERGACRPRGQRSLHLATCFP